jgi:hypothetical protein
MSVRVWIAQCLCPARHCVLATAGEAASEAAAKETIVDPLRAQVAEALKSGVINPWCGLCNARAETWRYDLGRTRFRSMDEAAPELLRIEAEQAATRALWGDIPRND